MVDNRPNFKVLFLYPNFNMSHLLIPAGVSILSAVLKLEGFQTRLFETTLYRPNEKSFDDVRLDMLQLKKFNLDESGVFNKSTDMLLDFINVLNEYKPDLIALSVLQDTLPMALPLIEEAKKREYPLWPVVLWAHLRRVI